MSNKENTPKAPKPQKAKKNFFDKAWDFLGAVARKPWFRIAEIVLATLLVILLTFYGASMLFGEKSGFTIAVGGTKEDKAAISLSESKDFSKPTVRLDAGGFAQMTNISVLDLPESFDSEGGAHNGVNYLAYTFYLKNSGGEAANIRSDLDIKVVVNGAEGATLSPDEAMRVRIYRNGNPTTYAKLGANGEPEYGTTPFAGDRKIFSVVEENVEPEEIIKYTVVVWLDGDDPECVDDIKGGSVKMSLTFSVDDAET